MSYSAALKSTTKPSSSVHRPSPHETRTTRRGRRGGGFRNDNKIERESRSDSYSGDEDNYRQAAPASTSSSELSPQPPMPFTAPEEPMISHAESNLLAPHLPGHGRTARQVYQERLENDPSYVPTVGEFRGQDDRLLDKDLHSLSWWWRGRWQGVTRARGFRSRGRGRGRGFYGGDTNAGNDTHTPGEGPPSLQQDVPPVDRQWAQKVVQESNFALEAHQKQVRTLEEYLAYSDGLKEQVEQLTAEKLDMEKRAAEQTETLRKLTEANATLSARALQLEQDVATARDELRAVSERDQTQRLALLEVINLVQTENGNLRQQLHALGK